MKRYRYLVNSVCLQCGAWLCVMAGTYTGEIVCGKCGAANVFKDTSEPCETGLSLADNHSEAATYSGFADNLTSP